MALWICESGGRLMMLLLFSLLLIEGSSGTICEYCKLDFNVVNRHVWRCKARITNIDNTVLENHQPERMATSLTDDVISEIDPPEISPANLNHDIPMTNDPPVIDDNVNNDDDEENQGDRNVNDTEEIETVKCYCGKVCKNLRGLQAHKRSCRILTVPDVRSLLCPPPQVVTNDVSDIEDELIDPLITEKRVLYSGVKLPPTTEQWYEANEYFKAVLAVNDPIVDVEAVIANLNSVLYKYFSTNYGTCGNSEIDLLNSKYKEFSNRKLKRCLREIKRDDPENITEIRFISKLLRSKFGVGDVNLPTSYDHKSRVRKNFWKYCDENLELPNRVEPKFNEATCTKYFRKVTSRKNAHKSFELPPWMETLPLPSVDMNLTPPTYAELTKLIYGLKSSASPCPHDQISAIVLKRCPIIRTALLNILKHCWSNKMVPSIWKRGVTILAYKKGDDDNPENFRPITLQPVMCKVYTKWMKVRVMEYLIKNGFIDQKIQKGFWSSISGTVEHTESLTYLINNAKNKQRSLVVSLIDLRNAFGEVNHKFLEKVLEFHHLPEHMVTLICDLYKDYSLTFATKTFTTSPIMVNRGVLQGDSLSPLLFNMCFNTLMVTINKERLKCLGYVLVQLKSSNHWLQFADDTAIITSLQSDSKLLLNIFSKWVEWSDLRVRIDKCKTFGICKTSTLSVQYEPYLTVCHQQLPTVEIGKDFVYLGKSFNFGMVNTAAKDEIVEKLDSYLEKIDRLPIHPSDKLRVLNTYVYSKLRWLLSIYKLDITWIHQHCDNIVSRQWRLWLNLHPGANVSHLKCTGAKLGLNLRLPSDLYQSCQNTVRRLMKNSLDGDIVKIYEASKKDYILSHEVISMAENSSKSVKAVQEKLIDESSWASFIGLKKQSIIIKFITENVGINRIRSWQKLAKNLHENIFNFCRRYLILSLPTKSNLKLWNISHDDRCIHCNKKETLHHVMAHCSAVAKARYTWRHDSVLYTIMTHLSSYLSNRPGVKLYADIEGYNNPTEVFRDCIPDVAVVAGNVLHVIELTVCFETNLLKSREYKREKYKNVKDNVLDDSLSVKLYTIEFSSIGFTTPHLRLFTRFLKSMGIENIPRIVAKCSEVCARSSYYIFNRRNKEWTNPPILKFQ